MGLRRRIKYCRQGHEMHSSWRICPACLKPIIGWLLGVKGIYIGVDFPIREGKNTVGRLRKNDITLKHPSISPEHAFIKQGQEDSFIVADLNSGQGIFVNGRQENDTELIDNYLVKFGELEFVFKCVPRFLIKR